MVTRLRGEDALRLVVLSAIWGSSYIFMKILAPAIGPAATACFRLLIGGSLLFLFFRLVGVQVNWCRHWKHYLVIGIVNSAVPFFLFALAALYIPASLSVILNSSSPLFGAVFSALWLGEKLGTPKLMGLAVGVSGVSLIAIKGAITIGAVGLYGVLACTVAAMFYALAGVYIKRWASQVQPMAVAGASQIVAGFALMPLVFLSSTPVHFTTQSLFSLLYLGIFSSALAYVLYFRLLADLGPTRALTVTYLQPIFGMLWSVIFLSEVISIQMIVGCALVFAGVSLVFVQNRANISPKTT